MRDIPVVMDAPPPDWCAARANGSYCDGRSVHTCTSNRTTRIEPCADGCYERGATSVCASDAVDPCFNDPDGTRLELISDPLGHMYGADVL